MKDHDQPGALMTKPLDHATATVLERVVIGGDLSKLSPTERMTYYRAVCESVGLNPLTQPFQYLYLQNKMTLYARKEATEQLREIHGVRVTKLDSRCVEENGEEFCEVQAYGLNAKGREDADMGVMCLAGLRGQDRANAKMKAVTKAKRRLTLSLCGLGMLDESEVDLPPTAIQTAEPSVVDGAQPAIVFPSPEEDRGKLIQRARIAMARLDKAKVAEWKVKHFDSASAELATVDLAALVAFVQSVEGEKL
jgi:hypothetical protein